jgi:hypothetical protein
MNRVELKGNFAKKKKLEKVKTKTGQAQFRSECRKQDIIIKIKLKLWRLTSGCTTSRKIQGNGYEPKQVLSKYKKC